MKKSVWVVVVIVVIILISMLFFIFIGPKKELLTVTGIYEGGKGGGTIGGVFLVYPPENSSEYLGKQVEVVGYAYEHKCRANEQCYGGKYMDKIMSIKIIEGCSDCGKGGWQKMEIKCSQEIKTKVDAIGCLSKQSFILSQIQNNISYIDKNIREGYINIGEYDFTNEPSSFSIQVFGFDRWAVDSDENIYLVGYLG